MVKKNVDDNIHIYAHTIVFDIKISKVVSYEINVRILSFYKITYEEAKDMATTFKKLSTTFGEKPNPYEVKIINIFRCLCMCWSVERGRLQLYT